MKNNKGQSNFLITSDVFIENLSISGNNSNITSALTTTLTTGGYKGRALGFTDSSNEETVGVCLDSPYNYIHILNTSTKTNIFVQGYKIYGKLIKSGSVYRVYFYYYNGSSEVSYNFSTTSVDLYLKYRFEIGQLPPDRDILLGVKERGNMPTGYDVKFSPESSGMSATDINQAILEVFTLAANNPSALTFLAPLYSPTPGSIGVRVANTSTTGVLTSTDWNSFTAKLASAINLGGIGNSVLKQVNGTQLEFRKLLAGAGINITEGPNTLTITATRVTPPGDDANYFHTQTVAANTWVVEHGLLKFPSVTVIDNDGLEIFPEITHDSNIQTTIVFKKNGSLHNMAGFASFN